MQIAECNEPVASNIKKIINEKGLKQVAVATRANFSQSAFNAMIRGRRLIKPCDVNNIAHALGVSANDLYKKEQEGSGEQNERRNDFLWIHCWFHINSDYFVLD